MNNPLNFVDPTGLFTIDSGVKDQKERDKIIAAYNKLQDALSKLNPNSKAYKIIERALTRLGAPDTANGVVITIGSVKYSGGADTDVNQIQTGIVLIRFDETTFANTTAETDASNLGHEAVHVDDAFNLFSQLNKSRAAFKTAWDSNDVSYRSEYDAFFASAGVRQALNSDVPSGWGYYLPPNRPGKAQTVLLNLEIWNPSWANLDVRTIDNKQSTAIMTKLEAPDRNPPYALRGYNLKRPKGFLP